MHRVIVYSSTITLLRTCLPLRTPYVLAEDAARLAPASLTAGSALPDYCCVFFSVPGFHRVSLRRAVSSHGNGVEPIFEGNGG